MVIHPKQLSLPVMKTMKAMLGAVGWAAVFFVTTGAANGSIRHVDNGNPLADDRNAGTEKAPWETIQQAADALLPGETVYVRAGTYAPFEVNVSGTAGKRIVFAAHPDDRGRVILDGGGTSVRGVIQSRGHSHIEIVGFQIRNAPADGIFVEGAPEGCRDIRVAHNRIDTTGNAGIFICGLIMAQSIGIDEYRLFDVVVEDNEVTRTNTPSGGNECISLGGGVDGFIIRRNWVHDSDQYGIDAKFGARNGEISENRIHGIEKHGIYIDCASRTIENIAIHGNVIHDNTNGIVLARESHRSPQAPNLDQVRIFNNLVYDNRKYGIMAYRHKWDTGSGRFSNIRITNNTIFRNATDGIRLKDIEDFATNFLIANNIIYRNAPDITNSVEAVESNNLIGVDPLFVSAGSAPDLHLTDDSPAIDAADAAFLPAMDLDRVPRPQGNGGDIGAYEFPPRKQ
jgi:hypothetical protein